MEAWYRAAGSPKTYADAVAAWTRAGSPNDGRWSALFRLFGSTPGGLTSGTRHSDVLDLAHLSGLNVPGGIPQVAIDRWSPPGQTPPPPRGGPPQPVARSTAPPPPTDQPADSSSQSPGADYTSGTDSDTPPETANLLGINFGDLLGEEVCNFSKSLEGMQATAAGKGDWKAVGIGADGYFKYSHRGVNGPWKTPMCRAGGLVDQGARDDDYAGSVTGAMTITDFLRSESTNGTGPGHTAGPGSKVAEGLRGVPARRASVWRCPPGYIMGKRSLFGSNPPMCFPKEFMTSSKFRENKPRRALVTKSDQDNIRKAKSTVDRIAKYANERIYKTRRARRRTEHHYHHTHRR